MVLTFKITPVTINRFERFKNMSETVKQSIFVTLFYFGFGYALNISNGHILNTSTKHIINTIRNAGWLITYGLNQDAAGNDELQKIFQQFVEGATIPKVFENE